MQAQDLFDTIRRAHPTPAAAEDMAHRLRSGLMAWHQDPRHAGQPLASLRNASHDTLATVAVRRHSTAAIAVLAQALPASERPLLFDACDGNGRTPAGQAAHWGQVDLLSALQAAGARLDLPDASGSTPLQHAAARGHRSATDYLIAVGAWSAASAMAGAQAARQRGFHHLANRLQAAAERQPLHEDARCA